MEIWLSDKCGGAGLKVVSMILEAFSNLNDSVILIISSGFKLSPATLVFMVTVDIQLFVFYCWWMKKLNSSGGKKQFYKD